MVKSLGQHKAFAEKLIPVGKDSKMTCSLCFRKTTGRRVKVTGWCPTSCPTLLFILDNLLLCIDLTFHVKFVGCTEWFYKQDVNNQEIFSWPEILFCPSSTYTNYTLLLSLFSSFIFSIKQYNERSMSIGSSQFWFE